MMLRLTFRRIERCKGVAVSEEGADSGLGDWYQSVRDKPLGEFSNKDFGIACRQRLYGEFVVPVLLTRLESDLLAGDMYEGELLVALAGLPRDFWVNNPVAACVLGTLLDSSAPESDDEDVIVALKHLRSVARAAGSGSGGSGSGLI